MSDSSPPVKKLTHHVFICTNERPAGHPRGSCKERGSEALLDAMKKAVAAGGLKGSVRAQKSGCLDVCEHGCAMVVYPEGIWYGSVEPSDATEIVESHLKGGKPVDRLRIRDK